MVRRSGPGLLAFLQRLGAHGAAGDLDVLARVGERRRRTVHRWLRALGERIVFYPSVRYAALGLVHVHAFIEDPHEPPSSFSYAAEAAWVANRPGGRILYLHCLVPAGDEQRVRAALGDASPHVTTITTNDGWQDNDLTSVAPDGRPRTRTPLQPLEVQDVATPVLIAQAYPLVIPVAVELLGRRASMHDLWIALYARLGERVWTYLPPRTRRWRHNGKAYVRHALELLTRYGLIRQYVVRYAPLAEHTIEVRFLTRSLATVERLRPHTPLLEYFTGRDAILVRAHADITLIKALLQEDDVLAWWITKEDVRGMRVRIEDFYDPTTGSWRRP